MRSEIVYAILAAVPATLACAGQDALPEATETISLSEPEYISGDEDKGFARYDRGSGACNGQSEGGEADTVFVLEDGASLSNVIMYV